VASLEDLGEVISTDVLIVGGGIGGIAAAIKAKEESPEADVLVVDKATIGWAGKVPKTMGALWLIAPGDDLDKFVEYHVRNVGCYLNDQELLYSYARESYAAIEQLAEWGAKLAKDKEGKLAPFKHLFMRDCSVAVVEIDMQFPLWAKARKMGAKVLNKVQVVDLLTQDGRVVGAVGFNIIDGRFIIFKAKATILANGNCCYKMMKMWSAACGEGIAAAYRAGTEMKNAEFGNYYGLFRKAGTLARDEHKYLVNALGENISQRYVPGWERDTLALALGMEKEMNEGRGPIYVGLSQMPPPSAFFSSSRPKFASLHARIDSKVLKYGPPASQKPEVVMGFLGELAAMKVDHEMKTSLVGLWAIGDTSALGSAWLGASSVGRGGGQGIMNAVCSALRGGPAAARFASEAAPPEVKYAEVKRLKENMFAPMQRDKGLLPEDVVYPIQDVVSPIKYSLRRSKDRLEETLVRIEEVQQRLPELWAKDGHGLVKCHEAKSMALCAEMTFRAALMRTESRGWHIREDYPKRDDKNWLKWIIIKQKAGKMAFSTEPVPIDKYKFKPYR
jgi:succinate dehydrogenase / fumarate reductase flavoprotein subunit